MSEAIRVGAMVVTIVCAVLSVGLVIWATRSIR
jgi:hypothetical protein